MPDAKRIAVIGAGPAGLSAAWELAKSGAAVTLYEARGAAGGRMRSDEMDGWVIDPAVQLFGSTYGRLFRLAREVGGGGLLERSPGRDALWRSGRPHAITYGSVASLVASTALPAGLKLRLATRYLPFLARHARRLDANDPAATGGAELDDSSVTEWGRAALGEDFVELLAYPLLGAYYGGTPERISVALYHALAKVGTDVHVYAVAGGVMALVRAIVGALQARGVAWRPGDAVSAVRPVGSGVGVAADSGTAEYEAVVIATPAAAARGMLAVDGPLDAWLARVESAPTATVALLLGAPPPGDFFGLSFPRRERAGDTVVAACAEHRKARALVPSGRGLLVAYAAPMIAAEAAVQEAVPLVGRVLSALEDAFPRLERDVVRARVYRLPEGYTLFYPGYVRHIRSYDESWAPARIALAGDYRVAPTVEGAVISGARAALRLLDGRR
jgi:oxygen-dependent protoporphyrinogen oxidase